MHKEILKVLESNKNMLVAKGITSVEIIEVKPEGEAVLKYTGVSASKTLDNVVTLSVLEGKIKKEVPGVKSVRADWYLPNK